MFVYVCKYGLMRVFCLLDSFYMVLLFMVQCGNFKISKGKIGNFVRRLLRNCLVIWGWVKLLIEFWLLVQK